MKDFIQGFILQIQFLTRIPVPVKIPYEDKLLIKGFALVPLVGLILGLLMAGSYFLVSLCGHHLIAILAVIGAGVLLTGGLHLDGFADTCDGLYSSRNKEKILEIMKDSRIGVMGTLGLILLFLFKTGLLFSLNPTLISGYIICMPVISRINLVWLAGLSPYAGTSRGMGAVYAEQCSTKHIMIATFTGIIPALLFSGYYILAPFLITVLWTIILSLSLKKRIGGITGDTLGYALEISEVLCLLILFLQEAVFNHIQLTGL